MKCPHCQIEFHDNPTCNSIGNDVDGYWYFVLSECPSCKRLILEMICSPEEPTYSEYSRELAAPTNISSRYFVRPKTAQRPPAPPQVPPSLAADYKEACLVLADSPKASAALSRRCLQHLLRDAAKVKHGDLNSEIDEILAKKVLPTHIAESVDAIRTTGNFAAHPIKSKASGEIIEVEPGEAEWNLDVLEALFDFYFVQPAMLKKKRMALDAKLKAAGKPPLK